MPRKIPRILANRSVRSTFLSGIYFCKYSIKTARKIQKTIVIIILLCWKETRLDFCNDFITKKLSMINNPVWMTLSRYGILKKPEFGKLSPGVNVENKIKPVHTNEQTAYIFNGLFILSQLDILLYERCLQAVNLWHFFFDYPVLTEINEIRNDIF